jgi:hypothetical protein
VCVCVCVCVRVCYSREDSQLPIRHLVLFAIQTLFTYLPKSRDDPNDLDARGRLQIAAWESLWPSYVPVPIGLSHYLGPSSLRLQSSILHMQTFRSR